MSFNQEARRVRNEQLPVDSRKAGFKNCVRIHCEGLYRVGIHRWPDLLRFRVTLTRFDRNYALCLYAREPTEAANLMRALDALQLERQRVIHIIEQWEQQRIRQKFTGRRTPSNASIAALKRQLERVTNDALPHP